MGYVVTGVGVPGCEMWVTAPNADGHRSLSLRPSDAAVFKMRPEAQAAIEEIRREDGAGAPLVFYVVEEQRRTSR